MSYVPQIENRVNRLVWLRNDLRLDDNETLTEALADKSCKVSFLFVYDKAYDTQTPEGQARMAPLRKKFLAESVHSLRLSLHPWINRLPSKALTIGISNSIILKCSCLGMLPISSPNSFREQNHEPTQGNFSDWSSGSREGTLALINPVTTSTLGR